MTWLPITTENPAIHALAHYLYQNNQSITTTSNYEAINVHIHHPQIDQIEIKIHDNTIELTNWNTNAGYYHIIATIDLADPQAFPKVLKTIQNFQAKQ